MRPFTAGSSLLVLPGKIEGLKWIAFAAMLCDHVMRYVFGSVPFSMWLLGRLAFPLFAISFALGIAHADPQKFEGVTKRLVMWGVLAAITGLFVGRVLPINILVTFALGLIAYQALTLRWFAGYLIAGLAALCGMVCEGGAPGVLGVATLIWWAREGSYGFNRWYTFGLGIALICLGNGDLYAALAVPVVAAAVVGQFELPRSRGVFHWLYAAHFIALAGLRAVL